MMRRQPQRSCRLALFSPDKAVAAAAAQEILERKEATAAQAAGEGLSAAKAEHEAKLAEAQAEVTAAEGAAGAASAAAGAAGAAEAADQGGGEALAKARASNGELQKKLAAVVQRYNQLQQHTKRLIEEKKQANAAPPAQAGEAPAPDGGCAPSTEGEGTATAQPQAEVEVAAAQERQVQEELQKCLALVRAESAGWKAFVHEQRALQGAR